MLPKNYSQNKKNNSENHDTAGIVLIIVFSFLLFCDLTGSLILGDIGLVVQNIIMGLIGYFSFPLFVYLIIRGIFLLQNKKLAVKPRNIVFLAIIIFCAVTIIQLATTSGNISVFGAYIDSVFRSKTIGGVFFALFAYALSAFLTAIGAYIVLSVIILVALLFLCGFFDGTFFGKSLSSNVKSRKVKAKDLSQNSNGNGFVTYSGDGNDLFIDTILPSSQSGVSSTFDSLPDESRRYYAPEANYNDYSIPKYSEEVNAMKKEQDERFDELMNKAKARQILFGDKEAYAETFGKSEKSAGETKKTSEKKDNSTNAYGDYFGAGSFGLGNYGYSSSEKSNSYESKSRQQSDRNDLDDFIVMPPKKDIRSNYVGGAIINADEQEPKTTGNLDAIKASVYEESYGKPVEDYENHYSAESIKTNNVNRSPIINADYYEEKEPVEPETEVSYAPQQPVHQAPIIMGSSVMANEPFIKDEKTVEKAPESMPYQAKIIRASTYDADIDEIEKNAKEAAKKSAQQETAVSEKDAQTDKVSLQVEAKPVVAPDEHAGETKTYVTSKIVLPEKEEIFDNFSSENEKNSVDGDIINDDRDDEMPDIEHTEDNIAETEPEEVSDSAVISDDFNDEDLSDDEEKELSNEEYMNMYGHPRFVQVSDEDAKKLSEKFEKNSVSFKFEDETVDASENAKMSIPVTQVQEQEKVVSVAPAKVYEPEKTNNVNAEKAVKEEEKPKFKKPYKYHAPSLDLLVTESTIPVIDPEAYEEKKNLLEETLENLGIPAKVVDITVGPSVTRYELNMPVGMSVKKIENCEQDIRYGLACKNKIRIESPIPGKKAVGIEVPNSKNALVALKDIISSKEFKASTSPLTIALGKDIQGKVMVTSIEGMPHLLIAGTTGSGKSACLNSLIVSLLYKSSPEDVKLILVDPKRVEFTAYSGLPHMMIKDAITEPEQVMNAFRWTKDEMERRYKILQANRVRNITEYNNLEGVKNRTMDKIPFLVIIVDEFADLMISSGTDKKRELENLISSISAKARAAGIHLILATQRPSAEIITGTIKSNLPCCIAFAVSNQTNSRIILDRVGAESLLGKGDMLYAPQDKPDVTRIQGAYIENNEVLSIVEQIKENNSCEFDDEFENAIVIGKEEEKNVPDDEDAAQGKEYDRDLADIVRMVIKTGQASGAMIQRRFAIGYMRAAKIIDQMESLGFIGPANGSKPREVYITIDRFKEFFGEEYEN